MSNLQQYNSSVSQWSRRAQLKLKKTITQLTAVYSGHARSDTKTAVRKYAGEASKINFSFPYYMVFVHKGAGRGYGGNITGKFTKKDGSKGSTNSKSKGLMGTGKRRPKEWFNPAIEELFPDLADIVTDYHGDKVIAKIQKILIR